MQKRTKVMITFSVVILLVVGLYLFTDWFSKVTGFLIGEDEKIKLAQCLAGKNAEFFGADYCKECEKQKKIFGEAFKTIIYVDCGREKENCPNIKSVPAWYINKTFVYGFRNFTELRALSGCADK